MRPLRCAVKLAAVTAVTAALFLTLLVTVPLIRALGGSPALWKSRVFRAWSRSLASIIGLRVSVLGTPPSPPFLLVSNHLSYVDMIVLASHVHGVFIAKGEVGSWPIVGRLCRAVDTLFIARGQKRDIPRVLAEVESILREGRGVVLFPEGTSTQGSMVLPFRPSLLETAARAGIPVSYAALTYRTPVGSPPAALAVCWWGDMPFLRHLLRLLSLPTFEAKVVFGGRPIEPEDRKVLAVRLWEAVQQQFQPV